ncbi:MAG: DUF2243 domain-containing protein [Dehalococcoidia bacterium]|nr:DUF2243 domain-containing protein [Dehalococcoidia bacterium]
MAELSARGRFGSRTVESTGRLPRGFIAAGILLGVGLGGFIDGIVLHQMLQWHRMLTATGHHPMDTVGGLETNTLWDGIFHAFAWSATAVGLYALWESAPVHRRGWGVALFGLILVGWALFNLTEGIVDHHILTIHHVRDDVAEPLPWDLGFLAVSVGILAAGWALARRGAQLGREQTA